MLDARSQWAFRFSAPVFIPTLIFSVVLVLAAALIPDQTNAVFSGALARVTDRFGWLTILMTSAMLVFLAVIALSPWGKIQKEVETQGLQAEVNAPTPSEAITLHVSDGEHVDFVYEIRAVTEDPEPRAEVFLKRGGQEYDVYGLEENELIADVLDQLERYLHFIREVGEPLPWEAREEVD